MTVKYKVSDFAKDLNVSAKKVLDELAAMGSTGKKNSSTLEENELNYLLEKFSKDNSVKSLDEFLNSAKAPKAEPKPAEKKAEPKAEKKPEAPKAEPAMAEAKPAAKQNNKKNEQHKKREEKTVSLSELARETGAKATAASAQSVSVRREDNQVTVDTRTVDMNVDRFDARYDDLASTKNTENRRKPTPQGNKQKFTQRGQRQRQQFQKGKRETEFERLQRIQLEKARNAQLKVMIPDEITVGELAARLKQQAGKVIAKFMQMGEMHAINDVIDFDTAALVAEERSSTPRSRRKSTSPSRSACSPRRRILRTISSPVPRSSASWATLTTARPVSWTLSARLTSPQARPAASLRPSVHIRSRSTTASSPSWIPRATRRSPPCAPAVPT